MTHWLQCYDLPHLILPLYVPMLYGPLATVLWPLTPDPATVYADVLWATGYSAVNTHTWSCHCICRCCMTHWLQYYGPHTWSCHCICQCCMTHWLQCYDLPHLILPLYMPMLYGPLAMVLWIPTPDPATVYANVVWPTGNGAVNPHTWSCHCICQCCMAHWLWCCEPPHLILPLYMPMLCDPLATVLWPPHLILPLYMPMLYGPLAMVLWTPHLILPLYMPMLYDPLTTTLKPVALVQLQLPRQLYFKSLATDLCSTASCGLHHRKHQSTALLILCEGNPRRAVYSFHTVPVMHKTHPFPDFIMSRHILLNPLQVIIFHGSHIWMFTCSHFGAISHPGSKWTILIHMYAHKFCQIKAFPFVVGAWGLGAFLRWWPPSSKWVGPWNCQWPPPGMSELPHTSPWVPGF